MQKKCGKCGLTKPLDDFHKSPKTKDCRASRCRACAIEASRESYERRKREQNPQIEIVREHRARLAAARAAGDVHFIPLLPCPAGHLGPRYTGSQCCIACSKIRRTPLTDEANAARLEKKRAFVKRKVAQQLGQTHYQGAPCKNGHDGKRLTSTRQCVECLASRSQPRPTKFTPESARRHLAKRKTRAGLVKQRAYQSEVLMKRPDYLAKRFMYACVRRILLGAGSKRRSRTADALGYTHQQLRSHIESLFTVGMNWDNYGEWHIDHVRSLSEFLSIGVTDPAIVNALSNLQPLWAVDNLSKGGVKGFKQRALRMEEELL